MKRNSVKFVPSSLGRLEERVVPTYVIGGITYQNGIPALTQRAINNTIAGVEFAFNNFGSNGQNYNALVANLERAINRIPFHYVDGLDAEMVNIVSQMHTNLVNHVPNSVIGAEMEVFSAIRTDVVARVQNGTVVIV
jgi:hypothetical protein